MNNILIKINCERGIFAIQNDGPGIDLKKKIEGIYLPERIFTIFRGSTNFNDNKTRYWGGRNGYGCAITTSVCDWLKIHIISGYTIYKQKFTCDGYQIYAETPIIGKNTEQKSWT